MTLLEGRTLAAEIRGRAAAEAAAGPTPVLAAVIATDDPGAAWYLGSIAKAAAATGIELREVPVRDAAGVLERLDELSGDPAVHGIICLTPLPDGLSLSEAGRRIATRKGYRRGKPDEPGPTHRRDRGLPPATAQAVIELIHSSGTSLEGARAVVVGRSTVVGKPLAMLLLADQATVTICHTRTRDLAAETRRAEVLVAAAGRAHLIGPEHVSPRARS